MTTVAINLLWLVPGVVGGTEEYAVELLEGVDRLAPHDVEVVLVANRGLAEAHPGLVARHETLTAPLSGGVRALRVAAEGTWLPRRARRRGVDIVHHLGGTIPRRSPEPAVVTVHDLQPLAFPEHFGAVKRSWLQRALPRTVARATRVLTLSEFVRGDLVERLGADPDRVRVVPPGLAPPPEVTPGAPQALRERWGLGDRPVFLYPAITYPHKNHEMLLEAHARLGDEHPEAVLVLTGAAGGRDLAVRERAAKPDLDGRVVVAGRVPRMLLEALFATATALVFPSRYEGFGLPVLEAMGRSCPVLAARATALPEVVGDGGLLLPPDDPGTWTEAMSELLDDDVVRRGWADAARHRAGTFAWESSARDVVALWQELVP